MTRSSYAFSSGIIFEFGAYAADTGDVVTGVFDNARISTLAPVTLSNFTINNGATVTAVSTTTDPKTLELTTTVASTGCVGQS